MMTGSDFAAKASRVRLLVLDVDGVLTDGSIQLDNNGDESKTFDVRDGFGLRVWLHHGFQAAVVTGRTSNAVACRCRDLGIATVLQGAREKRSAFEIVLSGLRVSANETVVMGDDIPDLPMLVRAGLAACPADADEAVIARVDWVATKSGGKGAVRELIAAVLTAKGLWTQTIERYVGNDAGLPAPTG